MSRPGHTGQHRERRLMPGMASDPTGTQGCAGPQIHARCRSYERRDRNVRRGLGRPARSPLDPFRPRGRPPRHPVGPSVGASSPLGTGSRRAPRSAVARRPPSVSSGPDGVFIQGRRRPTSSTRGTCGARRDSMPYTDFRVGVRDVIRRREVSPNSNWRFGGWISDHRRCHLPWLRPLLTTIGASVVGVTSPVWKDQRARR